MSIFYYKRKYYRDIKIQEINLTKFPVTIISDTHNNLKNIRALQALGNDMICLGDTVSLFDKKNEFNHFSISFFKKLKIPTLRGNHEEIVAESDEISQEHKEFLEGLPFGFKLNLPDGTHYLGYHNRPFDLWSFYKTAPTEKEFREIYPVTEKTRAVLIGHHHQSFKIDYGNCQLIGIGRLSEEGEYAILDESGITHKKL